MRRETRDALSDWLIELERQGGKGKNDGHTTEELAKAWGVSVQTARKRLGELIGAGRVSVTRVQRTSIAGVAMTVPAYQLVKGK